MPRKKKIVEVGEIITISKADLEAMIAKAIASTKPATDGGIFQDPTMDEPTGIIPAHLIADKSALPSPDARASSPVQPPARLWGKHIAPSPLQVPAPIGIVDPRTGANFNQVMPTGGTTISPPPTRNFGR